MPHEGPTKANYHGQLTGMRLYRAFAEKFFVLVLGALDIRILVRYLPATPVAATGRRPQSH
jgi:hypothetical protein